MHRTRFSRFPRALILAALLVTPALLMAGAADAAASVAAEPPAPGPDATDRERICHLLKILGKPCPASDWPSYEEYYAQVEAAWYSCDPNGFSEERRQELLAAALDVRDSQIPAPAGVDPVAYDNFMLVLDEIIYEMGG